MPKKTTSISLKWTTQHLQLKAFFKVTEAIQLTPAYICLKSLRMQSCEKVICLYDNLNPLSQLQSSCKKLRCAIRSISSQRISENNSDCLGEVESQDSASGIHFNMQTRGRNAAGWRSDMQASAEFMAFSGDGILGKIARASLCSLRGCSHTHSTGILQGSQQPGRERERERWCGLIFLVIHEWNAGMRARRLLL